LKSRDLGGNDLCTTKQSISTWGLISTRNNILQSLWTASTKNSEKLPFRINPPKLAIKLANTSFFNKNWIQDEIVSYAQGAYNTLRSQGKTGLQSIEINGEIINFFIKDDGSFDTAYGVYKYTVDDFRLEYI